MSKIRFKHTCCFIFVATTLFSLPATAFETAPAPAGKAIEVAKKVIGDNFEKNDCPSITKATRYKDGTIKAICSNGESFRVFTVVKLQKPVAMKCSAVKKLGISGC